MINEIKASLDSNQNLSTDIRDMIIGLTVIFNTNYPEVRLKNLNEKVKDLKIEKVSKFAQKKVMGYTPISNIVSFNIEKLQEETDVRHVLMHSLLQVITSNGKNTGFDDEHKYEALNMGYTELIANSLVGNNNENGYYKEAAMFTNFLGIILGEQTLHEAYFFNKPSLINKQVEELNLFDFEEFNNILNANLNSPTNFNLNEAFKLLPKMCQNCNTRQLNEILLSIPSKEYLEGYDINLGPIVAEINKLKEKRYENTREIPVMSK